MKNKKQVKERIKQLNDISQSFKFRSEDGEMLTGNSDVICETLKAMVDELKWVLSKNK